MEPGGHSFLHLHHLPSSLELFLCLDVVSTVCPHACLSLSHDAASIAASEAADVSDSLVAWGDVLAIMLVHVEANEGLDAILLHQSTNLIELWIVDCRVYHFLTLLLLLVLIPLKLRQIAKLG